MSLLKNNDTNEKKTTPKWISVFGICVLIACIIFVLVQSQKYWFYSINAASLEKYFNSGENEKFVKDTTTICNGSYYRIKHTVNGIPTCTEYYYLCGNDDAACIYVVRADKNFYDNFDAATGISTTGVSVSGLVREPSYELRQSINQTKADIVSAGYELSMATYYIDLMSFRVALGILIGTILILCPVALFVATKDSPKNLPTWISASVFVMFIIGLVVVLHYMNYLF